MPSEDEDPRFSAFIRVPKKEMSHTSNYTRIDFHYLTRRATQ